MIQLFVTLLTLSGLASALDMKYLTSDSEMTCAQGEFNLALNFDGTGDNVSYTWNGSPGQSPVQWRENVATFGLNDAQNGPFKLVFKNSNFYFQDVLCVEKF